jgi:hypothetical protein
VKTLPQALRAGDTPCWGFISDQRADFGVQRLCRVLGVSRSGYYRHLATEEARAERVAHEAAAVAAIRAIHTEHQGAYMAVAGRGGQVDRVIFHTDCGAR